MATTPKFKLVSQSRYLPGSVSPHVAKFDMKMYNLHLYNLNTATTLIDDKPPYLNPNNYVNLKKFMRDVYRLQAIDLANKKIVTKINYINRTGGPTISWHERKLKPKYHAWSERMQDIRKIMRQNKQIYKKICNAESKYKTRDFLYHWNHKVLKDLDYYSKYPFTLYTKKTVDEEIREQPSISGGVTPGVVRPIAYMSFRIKDGFLLGQILIELYNDFCPKAVENFLGFCNGHEGFGYVNCRVHNALRGKYFEIGDVTKNNGKGGVSIFGPSFTEEENLLLHTKQGVLSMVAVGNEKDKQYASTFCITLGPMPTLDGKRLVFGKVIKGNTVLCKINDCARKIGAPKDKIIISRCGQVPQELSSHASSASEQ